MMLQLNIQSMSQMPSGPSIFTPPNQGASDASLKSQYTTYISFMSYGQHRKSRLLHLLISSLKKPIGLMW
jgi:hypothetical protein